MFLHIAKIIYRLLFPPTWKKAIKEGMSVGKHCEIYSDVTFGSEPYLINIGDHVRITSGCKFVTHDGGVWVLRNKSCLRNADIFGKIKIGDNVHIGLNCIIMPGVTIGNNCIIGSGAVVTRSVPDNSIAVGVPARVIRNIDEYYEANKINIDYTKQMSWIEKKNYLCRKFDFDPNISSRQNLQ